MGGKILEFSADRDYNIGKAVGYAMGFRHGFQIGYQKSLQKDIGEERIIKLTQILLAAGKTDELRLAASDDAYRDSLYKEYNIC